MPAVKKIYTNRKPEMLLQLLDTAEIKNSKTKTQKIRMLLIATQSKIYTQRELARTIGVGQMTINRWKKKFSDQLVEKKRLGDLLLERGKTGRPVSKMNEDVVQLIHDFLKDNDLLKPIFFGKKLPHGSTRQIYNWLKEKITDTINYSTIRRHVISLENKNKIRENTKPKRVVVHSAGRPQKLRAMEGLEHFKKNVWSEKETKDFESLQRKILFKIKRKKHKELYVLLNSLGKVDTSNFASEIDDYPVLDSYSHPEQVESAKKALRYLHPERHSEQLYDINTQLSN